MSTGQKACVISLRWRVWQLRLTKYWWKTWLTTVIRHAISRMTVLVAVMKSRMMRAVHVPRCAQGEFHFGCDLSFPLGSAILKPDFNLSFSQLERFWSSVRREMVRYLLLRNSLSSSLTWVVVKAVRFLFLDGSRPLRLSLVLPSCCSTERILDYIIYQITKFQKELLSNSGRQWRYKIDRDWAFRRLLW